MINEQPLKIKRNLGRDPAVIFPARSGCAVVLLLDPEERSSVTCRIPEGQYRNDHGPLENSRSPDGIEHLAVRVQLPGGRILQQPLSNENNERAQEPSNDDTWPLPDYF